MRVDGEVRAGKHARRTAKQDTLRSKGPGKDKENSTAGRRRARNGHRIGRSTIASHRIPPAGSIPTSMLLSPQPRCVARVHGVAQTLVEA
jgi:hypothetical protein